MSGASRPRSVEEYLELPYTIELVRDEDDAGNAGYVAEVDELPGCVSQGVTPEEAIRNVFDAMRGWISVALDDGRAIPEPRRDRHFSGRFLLRIPQGLHAELARRAEREGVSLNQFAATTLAGAVGWQSEKNPPERTPSRRTTRSKHR
jgi:antitoxin HicB